MAKYEFAPFPLYEISGPPFERGLQYGQLAKKRIITSVEIYTDSLKTVGLDKDMLGRLSEQFLPKIKYWAPDLFEEMQGIAKGASLSLSEIDQRSNRNSAVSRKGWIFFRSEDGRLYWSHYNAQIVS